MLAAYAIMWIPKSIYDRTPQFWLLIGLLFIAAGLYTGFEYVLTTYYVGLGVLCSGYGAGILVLRLRHRRSGQRSETEAGAED